MVGTADIPGNQALYYMFKSLTPEVNTTYYTSNEIVYPLSFTLTGYLNDRISIISPIPTSIKTNETITLRVVYDTDVMASISAKSVNGNTTVTITFVSFDEVKRCRYYDLTIAAPIGSDIVQINGYYAGPY